MSGIRTRTAYKTLISTNIASGGADISALELREVQNSGADSLAFKGDVEIRVKSMALTAPPGSETDQDAYVPAATATGAWAGKEGQIAIWDAGISPPAYVFVVPTDGQSVWNIANDTQYRWDTGLSPSAWAAVLTGANALQFQETVSPSASVNVDLPLTTANAVGYKIIFAFKGDAAGDGDDVIMRVTDDGFTTVESGSVYKWNDLRGAETTLSASGKATDTNTDTSVTTTLSIGTSGSEQTSGEINLSLPHNASFYTGIDFKFGRINQVNTLVTEFGGGAYVVESDIDGIRLTVTPTTGTPTLTGVFHIFAIVSS